MASLRRALGRGLKLEVTASGKVVRGPSVFRGFRFKVGEIACSQICGRSKQGWSRAGKMLHAGQGGATSLRELSLHFPHAISDICQTIAFSSHTSHAIRSASCPTPPAFETLSCCLRHCALT